MGGGEKEEICIVDEIDGGWGKGKGSGENEWGWEDREDGLAVEVFWTVS